MSVIRQSYIIHSVATRVWEAMMDANGPTKMLREVMRFRNLEVKPKKSLVAHCWSGKQSKPSRVQISLTYENQRTYIDLLHEDVPDRDRDKINKGWKEFFFEPLKNFMEKSTGV